MRLREEDKNWLRQQIETAVAVKFEDSRDSRNPTGVRRVMLWLREWGAISALWAVPLALVGLLLTAIFFAANQMIANAKFQGATEAKLGTFDTRIGNIEKSLTRQALANQSALPLDEFKNILPTLTSTLASAQEQKALVPPNTITQIQKKLIATGADSAGYWPAVGAVLGYRSMNASFERPIKKFQDCADTTPLPTIVSKVVDEHSFDLRFTEFKDCVLTFDSQRDSDLVNGLLNGGAIRLQFLHCIIKYQGGPINMRFRWDGEVQQVVIGRTRMNISGYAETMDFIDSFFSFEIPSNTPATEGQRVMKTLLAQNGPTLKIPQPEAKS